MSLVVSTNIDHAYGTSILKDKEHLTPLSQTLNQLSVRNLSLIKLHQRKLSANSYLKKNKSMFCEVSKS